MPSRISNDRDGDAVLPPDRTSDGSDESIGSSIQNFARLLESPAEGRAVLIRPKPGEVLAGRFRIEALADVGGMGAVYRALDQLAGLPVAIKLIAPLARASDQRFREEARVLARLSHPGIVRYISDGTTAEGATFLAMEWLEGEDLAHRLAVGSLSLEQSLLLATGVAEALGRAHADGIVHRDIKPGNLFLVEGDPGRVKVLDFGIAQQRSCGRLITRTGAVLGTIGYMAPEQAKGVREITARADVFSLGCVLFECLAGRPAFASRHEVAALAKILLEEAPRLREIRSDIPPALDDLVWRMLSKDPELRPSHALAVLAELESIRIMNVAEATIPTASPPVLTRVEQHFLSVMLVELGGMREPSLDTTSATPESGEVVTLTQLARRFRCELIDLGRNVLLVVPNGQIGATDRAAHTASCALRLRREASNIRRIALATGRAETAGGTPVGPVIDRAVALLRGAIPNDDGTAAIVIDDVTRGLFDSRFEVIERDSLFLLLREQVDSDRPRTVFRKQTVCVGREKELAILEAIATQCVSDGIAQAVLITGPPGIGKSRLRREFLASLGQGCAATTILARADPIARGSSLMIVRQLIRNGMHLREGDPVAHQHAAIARGLEKHVTGAERACMADFLAELIELPPIGEPSPQLRAARNDSRIMNEWTRRTFCEWLATECAARPLILVLEDLHWGDLSSVNYIEQAFRKLVERPLLVVALAHPEVHEVLPKFRSGVMTHEILLGGLTRRAAEQLVRMVLGAATPDATVSRIVERAGGNPFYLEELIQTVAERGSDDLPDTVLAIAGARLQALGPEARLILRAASIFGNAFWDGGIKALVRGLGSSIDVTAWLGFLVDRELIAADPSNKFPGDTGYSFHHGLFREAAYAMLTDADRERGHLLAAEWLDRMGEKDALVLADHYYNGGKLDAAMPWLLRAAEVALNGANNEVAAAIAERGLRQASGETRGMFLEIQQLASAFGGNWSGAFEVGAKAMSLLPTGTTRWFRSAGSSMLAAIYLGRPETTLHVLRTSAGISSPEPSGPLGLAVHMLIGTLLHAGAREMVLPLVERLETVSKSQVSHDLAFAGWLRTARCTALLFLSDEVAPALAQAKDALQCFQGAADFVGWAAAALYYGIAHIEAGQADVAKRWLEEVIAKSNLMLLPTADFAKYYLARVEALAGRTALAESLLGAPPGLADGARGFVAEAHLREGRFELARREARQIEASTSIYARVTAMAILARISLAEGHSDEAIELLNKALAAQDAGSAVPFWRSVLHLSRVEALLYAGRTDAARTALGEAQERIMRIANGFSDPAMKHSYLTKIEPNARTLALAHDWLA